MSDNLLDGRALFEAKQCKPLVALAKQGDDARLDLGRRLIGCRGFWPSSGPNARGWKAFLDEVGIEKRTAQRYMAEARPKVCDNVSRTRTPRVARHASRRLVAFLEARYEQEHELRARFNYACGLDRDTLHKYDAAIKKLYCAENRRTFDEAIREHYDAWMLARRKLADAVVIDEDETVAA